MSQSARKKKEILCHNLPPPPATESEPWTPQTLYPSHHQEAEEIWRDFVLDPQCARASEDSGSQFLEALAKEKDLVDCPNEGELTKAHTSLHEAINVLRKKCLKHSSGSSGGAGAGASSDPSDESAVDRML